MRALGAAAVMLASLGVGCLSVLQMQKRLQCLRELLDALRFMAGELSGKQTPLPDLIREGGEFAKGDAKKFLQDLSANLYRLGDNSFFSLWEEAVCRQLSQFSGAERKELLSLGMQLGRTSLTRQVAALESWIAMLTVSLRGVEEQYLRERRMRLCLPPAVGAMLLILLL